MDDYIAVKPDDTLPMFVRSWLANSVRGKCELWPMVIEKAYAKMHYSWDTIDGGVCKCLGVCVWTQQAYTHTHTGAIVPLSPSSAWRLCPVNTHKKFAEFGRERECLPPTHPHTPHLPPPTHPPHTHTL